MIGSNYKEERIMESMTMEFVRKLPIPQEVKAQYPLTEDLEAIKKANDQEIADIFTGKSDKFLLIIGPCSADNEEAVLDYMHRLRGVYEKVKDKIFIIPEFIQINLELLVRDIKACFISQILKSQKICLKGC